LRHGMTTDTLTVLGLSRSASEGRVVCCSAVLRGNDLERRYRLNRRNA
jgi:hypothetical protein